MYLFNMFLDMRHPLIASAVLILIFSGCRRTQQYEVTGSILEYYSQTGVENAEVEIAYRPVEYGTISGGYETIASGFTDASGKFAITFDYLATSAYRVRVRKEGYNLGEEIVNADNWSTDDVNTLNLQLIKAASITLRLINTSNQSGQMLLRFKQNSVGCSSCCDYTQGRLFEGLVDTIFTCPVYGNQIIDYTITKLSGSNAVAEDFSVFADQGDYYREHVY